MGNRNVWVKEQLDQANYISNRSIQYLNSILEFQDDKKPGRGLFGLIKGKSPREELKESIEILASSKVHQLLDIHDISEQQIDKGIFPGWGDFSTWKLIPSNSRASHNNFAPEVYMDDIFSSVAKNWAEDYKNGNAELRDLPRMFYREMVQYQSRSPAYRDLAAYFKKNGCDLEDLVLQLDNIFLNSAGRLGTSVGQGINLWHTGIFASTPKLNDRQPLWLTNKQSKKDIYVGQLRNDLRDRNIKSNVYTILATTNKSIVAADFSGTSFHDLRNISGYEPSHPVISKLIAYWAELRGVDALLGTNMVDDEVVICNPGSDLQCNVLSVYPASPPLQTTPTP